VLGLIAYVLYTNDFHKRNFALAITSSQKLLDSVLNSLNRGDLTAAGAEDMLKAAGGIVDQVTDQRKDELTISLLANLYLTGSDINATLEKHDKAHDRAKEAEKLARELSRQLNDENAFSLLYNSFWRKGDAIADKNATALSLLYNSFWRKG